MTCTFTIPGEPVGKGRPRFGRMKNGSVHTYTPEKTANYENLVKRCWLDSGGKSFGGRQVHVNINAYFPIPKSYSKRRVKQIIACGEKPAKKPDCDNIIKIVLDALNGLAYDDDKQVIAVSCGKRYRFDGDDGYVRVSLFALDPIEEKI